MPVKFCPPLRIWFQNMWCDSQNTHIINDNFCMTSPPCQDKLDRKTELPRWQFKFENNWKQYSQTERTSELPVRWLCVTITRSEAYNSKLLYSGTRKLVSSEGQVLCADDERIGGNVQICSRTLREITRINMSAPIERVIDDFASRWTGILEPIKKDSLASALLDCITVVSFV